MLAIDDDLVENRLASKVLGICFDIHIQTGPGLLESVYEEVLFYELNKHGINAKRQWEVPLIWDGLRMEKAFYADIIVEEKLIIELKSVERLLDVHYKQLLTYLKLTGLKLGLLINFNEKLLKDGVKRVVNNL